MKICLLDWPGYVSFSPVFDFGAWMLPSWCCAHSHVILLYLIGILKEGQVIHASSCQPVVTDIGVHMKRFDWLRNDSCDFTLMITVFLRTHWSSFCSCEHLSFSGIDIITHGHYRRVNFFTLSSHSTQNCRWLRSGSLVEFTVSAYWDDSLLYSQGCQIQWVFCGSNS